MSTNGASIYLVRVTDGNRTYRTDRYVVVATSSSDAARLAADEQWPAADTEARKALAADEDRVEVGRLGSYDPGITGARMLQSIGDLVARMAE